MQWTQESGGLSGQPGSPRRVHTASRGPQGGSSGGSEVGGRVMGLRSRVQIRPIAGLRPPSTCPVHTHARAHTRVVLIRKTNPGL